MKSTARVKEKHMSGYDLTTALIRGQLSTLNVTANTKLVLLYFASCYNAKKGVVFPKIKTVADSLGISEVGVKRSVAELVEKGYILKVKKGGNTNQYAITNKITGYQNDTYQIDTLFAQNDTSKSIKMIPSLHEVKQDELKQTTANVVPIKKVEGVDKEETSRTAVSSFETIPDMLKAKAKRGEILNLEAYWRSLRPAIKQKYIDIDNGLKKQKQASEQRQKELMEYLDGLEEIKKEPPFYTLYSESEAREYITKIRKIGKKSESSTIVKYLINKFNISIND